MSTDDAPRPPDYTEGLGEIIRANRLYTGMSQRGFAAKLGMKEKSLSDIEIGRRPCPRGLLGRIEAVASDFDDEVAKTIETAEKMLGEQADDKAIEFTVDDLESEEWVRAVIGRAAVESGLITPKLVGEYSRLSR